MIPKPLDQVTLTDLTALIDSARESKTIEFKKELPATNDAQTKFLAGVSALANTAGGDFIIGIAEGKDGLVASVDGVLVTNLDAEKLRLENLLRDCIEPRLPRIDMHAVACPNGHFVLVIRVMHSWIGPHRVTKDNRFYGRNSAGKYPLDVGELRVAFGATAGVVDRIRAFRTERLAKIIAGEASMPLMSRSAIVLHMVPLPSFADRALFDAVAAIARGTHVPLPLSGIGTHQGTVNLDGYINYRVYAGDGTESYAQLFRSGAIEGVTVMKNDDGGPYLAGPQFANMVVGAVKQYTATLASLNLAFPVYAMLSLCRVDGCRLRYSGVQGGGGYYEAGPLKGNIIAFPEVAIENETTDMPMAMRPVMNMAWNAFGLVQCDMFNASGGWKGTA